MPNKIPKKIITKKILLIITGSVASYKSMDLIRLLNKKSFDVTCILTKAASQFVTPLLASSLSGNKTYCELFSSQDEQEMGHINLSRQSDLIVVAPASADFIAKIANGYADDLASSVVLAANKKIIIAPAMNEKMWENAQTQKNLVKALEAGVLMIEPEKDVLACGEFGVGKMSSPEKICTKIEEFFVNQNLLKGKKILLTAGSTVEPIDSVRFISNYSSGKQALTIVEALNLMGADVTVVAGKVSLPIPLPKEKIIRVKTAEEMLDAVKNNLNGVDVFIGCAAVADFKVKNFSSTKIKKTEAKDFVLELTKNPDILHFAANNKKRPSFVIGFAAEDENLQKNAVEKLQKKNCDLIVANKIKLSKGKNLTTVFGNNETEAFFVSKKNGKNSVEELGLISKEKLAQLLTNKIAQHF